MADAPPKQCDDGSEALDYLKSACQKLGLKLGSPRKEAVEALCKPQLQRQLTELECKAVYVYFKIFPGQFEWLGGGDDLQRQTDDPAALQQLREIERRAYQHILQSRLKEPNSGKPGS